MSKIDAQYEDLKKALKRLNEAAHLPAGNSINQDATIPNASSSHSNCPGN